MRRLPLWRGLALRCGLTLRRGLALRYGLALCPCLTLRRSLPLWRRGARCWDWTRCRRPSALSWSLSLSVFLRIGAQRDHQDCDPQNRCQLQYFFHDRNLRYNSPTNWRSHSAADLPRAHAGA